MLNEGEKIWKEILNCLKEKIKEENFSTWLAPTEGEKVVQNTLWVRVPNSFFVDWIEGRYREKIYETIRELGYNELKIKYNVSGKKEREKVRKFYYENSSNLQPRYTFDNFIVGESNKFAHAASLAVARAPGRQFNPLFIYGGVGLGKTHLLQGIGNYLKDHFSHLKIYYLGCEAFMNEMVEAIQLNKMVAFKNKYRNKDALLIDDVEFLEGKEGLQEEIFHMFNSLYEENKQIVFSSDRPPSALLNLEERLVSRFQGGLVCDIKPPSYEVRVAILKKKIETVNTYIPEEVLKFIAEKITTNIRDLEGALIKLCAYASLTGKTIDLRLAEELLKDIIKKYETKEINIERIQKIVANYYNISFSALRSKRRLKSLVLLRDIAIYLVREFTSYTLKEIGIHFGGRDHATMIHSYNKIKKKIENEEKFREEINHIIKLIKSE